MTDHDLEIPAHLVRSRKTPEEREVLLRSIRNEGTSQRHWVMPDPNKPKAVVADKIFVHDPALPVQVNVRTPKGPPVPLTTYDNMADFESRHDRKGYPVVQTASDKDQTIILVSAKPWAKAHLPAAAPVPAPVTKLAAKMLGHFEPAANAEKKPAVEKTPKTAAQSGPKPKVGDAWADSILKACAEGATRNAVIDFLCAVYPREARKTFDNVMYGTLERLVAAGRLTKAKEGKNVLYRVTG